MTGEESTAEMVVPTTTIIDHRHPLYLQASNSPGLVIILIKLTGLENYSLWSRSMKLALQGKGKLGFVDGNCTKIKFKGKLEELWEKCNAIVLSCIGSTVFADLIPIIVYALNAKKKDFLAMIAGKAQGYRPKRPGGHGGSRGAGRGHGGSRGAGVPCVYCGYKGHLKDDCYMVVGYLSDFISKRKASQQSQLAQPRANLQPTLAPVPNHGFQKERAQMILLVQDQVTSSLSRNIMNYLGSRITQNPLVNMYLTWQDLLFDIKKLDYHLSDKVQGLYNDKVLGIGREMEGLYLLQEQVTPTTTVSFKPQAEGVLWHLRLGHPSSTVMQHIPSISKYANNNIQDRCHICPLAKHPRLVGAYRKPSYDKKY
ncbi:hypothetical protein KY285_012534 [Solanum tuberosum]|nr:hypothetical protein KY285_012534 [Solanum tuberosum]